jgi:hypothetical protein
MSLQFGHGTKAVEMSEEPLGSGLGDAGVLPDSHSMRIANVLLIVAGLSQIILNRGTLERTSVAAFSQGYWSAKSSWRQ